VLLGVTLCVRLPIHLYHVSTACRISLSGKGNALYPVLRSFFCYLCRHLASKCTVLCHLVSHCHVCLCWPSCLHHVSTARCISLGGEGNALYPVLSTIITRINKYSNTKLSALRLNKLWCEAQQILPLLSPSE